MFLLASLFAAPAQGMFRKPNFIPVERMLNSAQKYLMTHPASAEAHYTLARIHYLAFINSNSLILGFSGESPDDSNDPDEFFYPARGAESGLYFSRYERARELARAELARGNARAVNENTVVFWPTVASYMVELERTATACPRPRRCDCLKLAMSRIPMVMSAFGCLPFRSFTAVTLNLRKHLLGRTKLVCSLADFSNAIAANHKRYLLRAHRSQRFCALFR